MQSPACDAPPLQSGLDSGHSCATVSDEKETEINHADQQTRLLLSWAVVLHESIGREESSPW